MAEPSEPGEAGRYLKYAAEEGAISMSLRDSGYSEKEINKFLNSTLRKKSSVDLLRQQISQLVQILLAYDTPEEDLAAVINEDDPEQKIVYDLVLLSLKRAIPVEEIESIMGANDADSEPDTLRKRLSAAKAASKEIIKASRLAAAKAVAMAASERAATSAKTARKHEVKSGTLADVTFEEAVKDAVSRGDMDALNRFLNEG